MNVKQRLNAISAAVQVLRHLTVDFPDKATLKERMLIGKLCNLAIDCEAAIGEYNDAKRATKEQKAADLAREA
jgi:hypothetical protein